MLALEEIARRHYVTATRRIEDSPGAIIPCPANPGDRGEIVDVDMANGIAFVDFHGAAIACAPEDLRP